jgi:hypothetical protein
MEGTLERKPVQTAQRRKACILVNKLGLLLQTGSWVR